MKIKVKKHLTESTANSNGIYSLKNGWLKVPVKDDIPDNIDLQPELSEWITRSNECETIEDVDSFIDDVYKLRQESILMDGEYGKGNLIFKELRNQGVLQALKDKKVELETKEMSLESYNKEDYNSLVEEFEFSTSNELDGVRDNIMKRFDNKQLADDVVKNLGDQFNKDLVPEKVIDLDEAAEAKKLFEAKNQKLIKEYRMWSNTPDEEMITEEKLDKWAVNKVSCENNYDYNDLTDLLLGRN